MRHEPAGGGAILAGIHGAADDRGRGRFEPGAVVTVNTHRKGVAYEHEIAAQFQAAGFQVRGLEAGGDHLIVSLDGHVLHIECKRHERLQLPIWLRQQEKDCPPGARRGLAFRQSRQQSYVVEPLEQFIVREARLAELEEAERDRERHESAARARRKLADRGG